MKNRLQKLGFTIMELMVVVILIGIIAAFAIPNYSNALARSHERDMRIQLQVMHAANQIYRAGTGNGDFLDIDCVNCLTAVINTTLSINVLPNNTVYDYGGDGTTFTIKAIWGPDNLTVEIDENPLSTTNPGCTNSCP